MANLALVFDIVAKDRASKEFRNVGDAAEKTGGKAKKMGLLMAGAAAAGAAGLFAVLKNGAAGVADNQAAMAQLEAGLKSTKNAAKVTTSQMAALADSIQAKTGTDGDAVLSGAALLATFTKVRNELGKGNDVFTRATQAGVDLAARGFGTVETNAVSLGKALNDPIKGITALGKQGISFTEDQKKVIKSLVESGNTLDAQKIILAAVEEQVGGSAEAYGKTLPGQLARARHAFDEVQETVFKAVLPAVTKLLEFVMNKLIPGLQEFWATHGPAIVNAFKSISSFVTGTVVPALKSFGEWVNRNKDFLIPFIATIATLVAGFKIYTAIQKAVTIVTAAWNAVLLMNPIGLVVIAIAALVAGLVVAYQRSETFRDIVKTALDVVKTAFVTFATAALGVIDKVLGGYQAMATAAGKLPGPLGAPFRAAADAIGVVRGKLSDLSTGLDNLGRKKATPSVMLLGAGAAEEALVRLERRITNIGGVQVRIPVSVGGGGRAGGAQARARGGPVRAGQPYRVGELGPELIVPQRSGYVLTAKQTAAMGAGGNNYNLTVLTRDGVNVRDEFRRMELLAGGV